MFGNFLSYFLIKKTEGVLGLSYIWVAIISPPYHKYILPVIRFPWLCPSIKRICVLYSSLWIFSLFSCVSIPSSTLYMMGKHSQFVPIETTGKNFLQWENENWSLVSMTREKVFHLFFFCNVGYACVNISSLFYHTAPRYQTPVFRVGSQALYPPS